MPQPAEQRSVIKAAAQVVRDLVSRPFQMPEEFEDDSGSTIFVNPLPTEIAIENEQPSLYPANGYIQDGIQFLRGRTIWAIDGGILTWQFPNGLLIVGRAVVSRMSFTGTETVQRVFDIPVVPFIVYPPLQGATLADVETQSKDYLQFVLGNLPEPTARSENRGATNYFSDSNEFLASLPEGYYAASGFNQAMLARYVDQIRDAAEMVAFVYALKNADTRHIVMRDGRIHGGAGFLTRLVSHNSKSDNNYTGVGIVRDLLTTIRNAVDHGVRVLGVIKHPRSNYCTRWYSANGVDSARYTSSDALLFYRRIEPEPTERTKRVYGAGKRSCLWQIRETGYAQGDGGELPINVDEGQGRELVHWFYQNTGCFFLKPKEGVLPIRVDFILHNNHYRSWFADGLVEQVYTLCTGSGSPLGLPQSITIADNYAKVRRPELNRSIAELIAQFEGSDNPDDQKVGRELRAYLDIYYRGAMG